MINSEIPKTYIINGEAMVQLPSTLNSGNFKFRSLRDGEIHLFEKCEIPKHYLKDLEPLPINRKH